MHLVVHEASEAKVRGRFRIRLFRKRPLTLGCRLAVLPGKGETRPSPRKRGDAVRTTRRIKPSRLNPIASAARAAVADAGRAAR